MGRQSGPDAKRCLQETLDRTLAHHRVAGASVAILDGDELTTAVSGSANIAAGVAVTPETVMHIGSITKVLNATLVMQLVDEGRVDLDEPVRRYLPDLTLSDAPALDQITVRMLLAHTSGIDGEMLPDHGHDDETIEKGFERFAQLGVLFKPGTEFSYCNVGAVIAGVLVQRLTGKSWYRAIRERLFEPLRMAHAAALPEEALLHRASVGHFFDPHSGQLTRAEFPFLPMSFAPCGTTLMMSANDLASFACAHINGGVGCNGTRILSQAGVEAMQQVAVRNCGKGYVSSDMGLGWMIMVPGLFYHSGGGPGVASAVYVNPQQKWAAAILTNSDHGYRLIDDLVQPWLEGFGVAKPAGAALPLSPNERRLNLDSHAGVYEDVTLRYRVTKTPQGLELSRQMKFAWYNTISAQPSAPAPLIPLRDGTFLWEGGMNEGVPERFRVLTFRAAGASGQFQYLAWGSHLYPRVSA